MSADEKIAREMRLVLEKFPATGAIIVSDGEDDESVIPVIQGVLPIVSVKRVVMKTSRTVEYSYAVLGRYLKMIAYDPKYSKFFLGLPGVLLLVGGIGSVFGYTAEIFAVLVSVFGGALLVRAFDVDKALSGWTRPTPSGFIRLFMLLGGAVLVLSSIPAGLTSLDPAVFEMDIGAVITDKIVLGQFVAGALPILWVGAGAVLAGAPLASLVGRTRVHTGDILRLVVLGSLYPTVYQFTNIVLHDDSSFSLIIPLLGGLAATLVAAGVLFWRSRRSRTPHGD
jgi:putative membrane protein